MKYMTFNSSCSYAGVANMLTQYGVDTDDRTIAMEMRLPYLFTKEDGVYLAGPMLQSAGWFDLYLNPMGYTMNEVWVERDEVPSVLQREKTAMLGLRVSPRSKHAVVYLGVRDGRFVFLNNKWQRTDEPERLILTGQELLERLDERVVIATVLPAQIRKVDFRPILERSIQVLGELKCDIQAFCSAEQTQQAVLDAMNTVFRAIMLDGVTMLELSGQTALAEKLRAVRIELMEAVRKGTAVKLSDEMSVAALLEAIDEYAVWISEAIG